LVESRPIVTPSAGPALEQRLRAKLADWRRLLTENVETGREVGPLRFTPVLEARRRGYAFHGAIALDRLVSGVIELKTLTGVASPSIPSWNQIERFLPDMAQLRQ
jgi:hypothetical protein